ncbi:uncharacterized protein [Palaemon carinicauda]|uniref:uncharacterized protein n=1 Tax=Palaemon carinicauda TaxID=392227 RepID=UPI0035B5F5A0
MKHYVHKLELDKARRASRSKAKSASERSLDISIDPLINSSLEVEPSPEVVTPAPSTGTVSADDPRYARMAAELKAIKDQLSALKEPPPLIPDHRGVWLAPNDSEKKAALQAEVEVMLEKRALQPVHEPPPGFYSRLFLVLETSNRPLGFEQIHQEDALQDGHTEVGSGIRERRGLHDVPGSQGCLLPGSRSPLQQEVSQGKVGFPDSSIQDPLLRSVDSPSSLHESLRPGLDLGTQARHQTDKDDLPGNGVRFPAGESLPVPGETRQPGPGDAPIPGRCPKEGQGLAEISRSPGLIREVGSAGQAQTQTSSVEPEGPLVRGKLPTEDNPGVTSLQRSSPLVVRQVEYVERDSVRLPSSGDTALHRRIEGRVGSTSPQGNSRGEMVSGGKGPAHQSSGAHGSAEGIDNLRPPRSGELGSPHVRQRHGSSVHQETRRAKIKRFVRSHSSDPGVGRRERHSPIGQIHSRKEERLGGRAKQERQDSGIRVVPSPPNGTGSPPSLGLPSDRLIRHKTKREAPRVLLPDTGSESSLRRRLPAPLGQPRRIRLSPLRDDQTGAQQVKAVKVHRDDFGSALVAGEGVVCGSARPSHSPAVALTSKRRPAKSTTLPKGVRKPSGAEASRVEVIKRLLRKEGFSDKTADRMSGYLRRSSCVVYQAKWTTFVKWCATQNLQPLDIAVHNIADFLVHLRDDLGVSIPAIKGVRAALGQVFQLKGINLGTSRHISMLIRSFEQTCDPRTSRVPQWDVAKVLKVLSRPPYEPLKDVLDKDLTLKAIFLLALASAKRVSELHGLSFEVSHSKGWKDMTFKFLPEFVAKTQNPAIADPRFEEFSIPAIPRSGNPSDLLLYPVRTIRKYLSRTAKLRPVVKSLFVSTGLVKKAVSKNTTSFWLRQVIRRAYENEGSTVPGTPRPHDIRGLSTSLAFGTNMALRAHVPSGVGDPWNIQSQLRNYYVIFLFVNVFLPLTRFAMLFLRAYCAFEAELSCYPGESALPPSRMAFVGGFLFS